MSKQCEGWARGRGVCRNSVKDTERTCRLHGWQESIIDQMNLVRHEEGPVAVDL